MGNTSNIELSFLGMQDLPGLCNLYLEVFTKVVDEDYFIFKYGLNLENVEVYSVVAKVENEVIGFFGGIEQSFTSNNQEVKMLSCGDYILKKELRGKSVFDQLYEKSLEKARLEQLDFVYAFQSVQTYKVAKKWGWKDEIGISRFHIKAFPFSTSKLGKVFGLSNWRIHKLEKELARYYTDINVNDLTGKSDFYEHHYDNNFFEMKMFAKHYWIEIEGCVLWLKYDFVLTVGFAYFKDNSNLNKLIRQLKSIARKALIHEVVFHLQENSSEAQVLSKFGTLKDSFKVNSLQLNESSFPFSKVKLNFMDMDIF